MSITRAQQEMLLAPIARSRVESRQGMSYVNVSDVRRYLIRIFGFGGFSTYADEAECVSVREGQGSSGKNWEVVWKVRVRLYIESLGVEYTEYAVGSSSQPSLPEAHDMAIKTAESDALKRCAVNLGDQFGLSLYFSKGRELVTQSVMRVYDERKVTDGPRPAFGHQPIVDDVQAAPEASSPRHGEEQERTVGILDAHMEQDDDHPQYETDPTDEAAMAALAGSGIVGVPADFFDRLTAIKAYKTQATRLKHAAEYKQELMRLGVRDDALVATPNGQQITVGFAFDHAMKGEQS